MAGDWIKMRGSLISHPKLIRMAQVLESTEAFREWLLPGGPNTSLLSDAASRAVTLASLTVTWSMCREHGKFVGEDLHLCCIEIEDLDGMSGIPGVGLAMEAVGWAKPFPDDVGVILPNFKEFNVPTTTAERSKQYRQRVKEGTVTPRHDNHVEKRREEKRRTSKKEPPIAPHSELAETIQTEWNAVAIAVGLPQLRKPPGKKGLRDWKLRMSELSDEFWEMVLDECRHLNAFARGDNDRKWRIDFSYVVTAAGAEKLRVGGWRGEGSAEKAPTLDELSQRERERLAQ